MCVRVCVCVEAPLPDEAAWGVAASKPVVVVLMASVGKWEGNACCSAATDSCDHSIYSYLVNGWSGI